MIRIEADWICEYCYKPAVGNLPATWELIFQSAVCPDCLRQLDGLGGVHVVKCGQLAFMPDPRAAPEKAGEGQLLSNPLQLKEDRLKAEGITDAAKPEVKDHLAELYHLWCEGRITAANLANKAYLVGYLKRKFEEFAGESNLSKSSNSSEPGPSGRPGREGGNHYREGVLAGVLQRIADIVDEWDDDSAVAVEEMCEIRELAEEALKPWAPPPPAEDKGPTPDAQPTNQGE
jgi:hypothetical protein